MADGIHEIPDLAADADAGPAGLTAEPVDLDLHRRLAYQLYDQGRRAEAAPHLRILVASEPGSLKLRRRLAQCLEAAGDDLGALGAWREALAVKGDDLDTHLATVRLTQNIDRGATAALLKAAYGLKAKRLDSVRALARQLRGAATIAVNLWRRVLTLAPGDLEAHEQLAQLLRALGKTDEAAAHVVALAEAQGDADGAVAPADGEHILFVQDGKVRKASYAYYRGETTNFYPTDESFEADDILSHYVVHGMMPPEPLFDDRTNIVAFGSCFAAHISTYLENLGFLLGRKNAPKAYVSVMGDGIVNSHAIRQQFEWAWEARKPAIDLWHGYDAKALGYDEEVRLETKRMFDAGDAFIITLGLSEVWYDEPTGEVFWRAVPKEYFDPSRHKFRVTSHAENTDNLRAIYQLIRRHRPQAKIIMTLSPIALTATFRPIACMAADSVSKAILRSALDEFMREAQPTDPDLYYFPSYEIATRCFTAPFNEDRKHVHNHVLDLNMAVFERYFCKTGMTDEVLLDMFRQAQALDRKVMRQGHWAVERRSDHIVLRRPPRPVEPAA
jgi:hypothetical protein